MQSAGLLDKCARFHLSVYVHSQISRTRKSINLQAFYFAPRYSEIIGVLLAILRHRVVGPHVFFFRSCDCRLQHECATTHTHIHTHTHTANPTTATMTKFIGDTVT